MRDEIAYGLILLLLVGALALWWNKARQTRRRRNTHLRVDLLNRDGE